MMVIGLAWLVVTTSRRTDRVHELAGFLNFAIGFALMIGGLLMTMRWR